MSDGSLSETQSKSPGGGSDLQRLLDDPSLDPVLRESLRMSLQAHEVQTRGAADPFEAAEEPVEPVPSFAHAEPSIVVPVAPEAPPALLQDPEPVEPQEPERPLTRKEQVARYPLHFRLRMLKTRLWIVGGAFLGAILVGAGLLTAYWSGLGEATGRPTGLLMWYAGLTLTSYLGMRFLDRKVSLPEGLGLVCQVQTLLLPMAGLAVGWSLTMNRTAGTVLAVLLAAVTWFSHHRVERWLTPQGGQWFSRFGVLAMAGVVGAPFLAFSPVYAVILAAAIFLVGERSYRRVERIDMEPWHENVLPYSLLAGPFVCAWAAVGFSGRSGGAALAPLLVVAVCAAIYFQHRILPTLNGLRPRSQADRRMQWGLFSLGGLALAVSLVDRDSLVFASAGAAWLAYLVARRLHRPLLLLPALLGSVLGHGALVRRVADFWPQPDVGLFMTLAFLPYLLAVAFAWSALARRNYQVESLVAGAWFVLVTMSLVAATWMMGSTLQMGWTLAGVGLSLFAAGGLMARPRLSLFGTVALAAATGLTLQTLGYSVAYQVTTLSLIGVGLFLVSALLQHVSRPRIQRLAAPLQDCGLALAPVLVAVGLGVGERPFLAATGAPVPALASLALLWCCCALSLRRADVAWVATGAVAWTWHMALSSAGYGQESLWRVPFAAATALMPWALEELSRRRRFVQRPWPGALRARHAAPLVMLALQAPLAMAWPSLQSTTLTQTVAVSSGWALLAVLLATSGLRNGLRWPVYAAILPFTAAAALPAWPMGLQVCAGVAGGALLVSGGLAYLRLRRRNPADRWDEETPAEVDEWEDVEQEIEPEPGLEPELEREPEPLEERAEELGHLQDLADLGEVGGGDVQDWMPFEEDQETPTILPRPRGR